MGQMVTFVFLTALSLATLTTGVVKDELCRQQDKQVSRRCKLMEYLLDMFGDGSTRMSARFKLSPGTHVTPDQVQV